MLQTRDQVKHHANTHRTTARMVLEDPFDLAIYTPTYMRQDPPLKNFRDGENAWNRFLAARPLLYLPDRSPVVDEDPMNRHRRIWTHQELQDFGDVVEERTRIQILVQERTLRCWHESATHIQRCFRGLRGRLNVLQHRRELLEFAATARRAMEMERERQSQQKAAHTIQIAYRTHRKLVIRREQAASTLQTAMKRFMTRRRILQARLTVQKAARCFLWRLRWWRYRRRVKKMLKAAARKQQLLLTTEAFRLIRQKVLLQRQANTWAAHPERTQLLLRVRKRQEILQASSVLTHFPLVQFPAKLQEKAAQGKPNLLAKQRQQVLPSLQP